VGHRVRRDAGTGTSATFREGEVDGRAAGGRAPGLDLQATAAVYGPARSFPMSRGTDIRKMPANFSVRGLAAQVGGQ